MTGFFFVPVWGFAGPAFWIVVIGLIVLSTRGTRGTGRDADEPAVRLVEERYARGEITREEFHERRAVLGGTSPGTSQ
jgi:uncharacterized membrane protein